MAPALLIEPFDEPAKRYVGWAPVQCFIRLSQPTAAPTRVRVSCCQQADGGQLVFRARPDEAWALGVDIEVPGDGSPVPMWIAGMFQYPSRRAGDVLLTIEPDGAGVIPASVPMTVRVRKDAETLSDHERDLFLDALATFNDGGAGRFREFCEVHDERSQREMHGHPGFLPWHRAFLLDLERELQAIDPAVALPYWRVDRCAPRLFSEEFLGAHNSSRIPTLSSKNPLITWVTDQIPGINRRARWNPLPAQGAVITAARMGSLSDPTDFAAFTPVVDDIHGIAHRAFSGFLPHFQIGVRDPLFFLLHAGIDREWALWQQRTDMMDPAKQGAFVPGQHGVGHNLQDTMWPWNQQVVWPRPNHAVGGNFVASPIVTAPGPMPRVEQMFDYQGLVQPANRLGFDYDDVPCLGVDIT
jgi:tyrosinase